VLLHFEFAFSSLTSFPLTCMSRRSDIHHR
jgi:hypothetical protein